jgi:hypothetical protein
MNPIRRRTQTHFGQAGDPYGSTSSTGGYGGGVCATSVAPVVGNAGVPGCGTGTLPGTECALKIVFRNSGEEGTPGDQNADVEVLAGRGGAFKPRAVYMVGIGAVDPSINVRFEILNVTVMGQPQLINYNGLGAWEERGLTDFFNLQCMPQPVDWQVFGSSIGQGLVISIHNLEPELAARFYIAVWGDAADCALIGKA